MTHKKTIIAGLFMAGSMAFAAATAQAQDEVLLRVQAGESNFCHLRFPAMQEHTLNWDEPLLKAASSGDIIDFYGPCNYDPNGKQAVASQKKAFQRQLTNDYLD